MKFLALLEDSFREAVASYVSMVQIALSIVLIVLLASVSFQPLDAAAALRPLGPYLLQTVYTEPGGTDLLPPLPLNPRDPFVVQGARSLDGAETPSSTYLVTLAVQCNDASGAEALRRKPERVVELVGRYFGRIGNRRYVEVTEVHLATADETRRVPANPVWFDVTVRPTGNLPLLWPYQIQALFGLVKLDEGPHSVPLGIVLYGIENNVINTGAAWIVILLSIVVSAFLVPNMLRKGSVDLLLVRPLHRTQLLMYKYLTGVLYILVNVALLIAAAWLVVGVRTGVWKPGLLLSIPAITFFFAILYAVSTLNGVVTRSAVTAILVTCIVWFGLFLVGQIYAAFDKTRNVPSDLDWAYPLVDTLHAVLPRTSDLDLLVRKVLAGELLDEVQARQMGTSELPPMTWGESLTVSAAFIAVMLSLASWRFSRRDY